MSLDYNQLVERAKLICPIRRLEGHNDEINSIFLAPEGNILGSASSDLILYDLDSNSQIVKTNKGARVISFSSKNHLIAKATFQNVVPIYDLKNDNEFSLEGHTGGVNYVVFDQTGNYLASAACDKTLRVWDIKRKREFRCLKGHEGWVTTVTFSPDGQYLASGSTDHTVRLWHIDSCTEVNRIENVHDRTSPFNLSFSPDGQFLASASPDWIFLWDRFKSRPVERLKITYSTVACWSPNGNLLFVRSHEDEETLTIFHIPSKRMIHRATSNMPNYQSMWISQALSISSDGRKMVTYSPETLNALMIYDISPLECWR